jgi:hypothetical protein
MKGFVDKENGKLMAKEVPHGSLVDTEKYNEKIDIFLDKFWRSWHVLKRLNLKSVRILCIREHVKAANGLVCVKNRKHFYE